VNLKVGDLVSMLVRGYRVRGIVTGFETNPLGVEIFTYHNLEGEFLPDGWSASWNYLSLLNKTNSKGEKLVEVISEAQDR
jgi:hypothetical protein